MKTFKNNQLFKIILVLGLAMVSATASAKEDEVRGRGIIEDDLKIQITTDTGTTTFGQTSGSADASVANDNDSDDDQGLRVGQEVESDDRGSEEAREDRKDYINAQLKLKEEAREKAIEERKAEIQKIKEDLTVIAKKSSRVADDANSVADDVEENGNKSIEARAKIEARSKFKTFLFGTDYKNLGVIRSTLVKTQNQIDRLLDAKTKTTDTTILAEIDAQIVKLQAILKTTDEFVNKNEKTFSLFGWAAKLFSKETSTQTTTTTTQ
jgi:hypothetical protein